MARSTCMKCGGTRFEAKEAGPINSNFKVQFIQCAGCGGVVGVMDYYNIGALLHTIAKALKINL